MVTKHLTAMWPLAARSSVFLIISFSSLKYHMHSAVVSGSVARSALGLPMQSAGVQENAALPSAPQPPLATARMTVPQAAMDNATVHCTCSWVRRHEDQAAAVPPAAAAAMAGFGAWLANRRDAADLGLLTAGLMLKSQ